MWYEYESVTITKKTYSLPYVRSIPCTISKIKFESILKLPTNIRVEHNGCPCMVAAADRILRQVSV